jgi:hypothetical protein
MSDAELKDLARMIRTVLRELRALREALEANRVIKPTPKGPKPLGTSRPAGG